MPVDMPAYAFSSLSVMPDLGISSERSEGGLIITSHRSDPHWQGPMTTVKLGRSAGVNQHADFLAFLSRCVDLNMRVDFVHPLHQLPVSYTLANWPMLDNAELVTVPDLRHIVVRALPMGLALKRGDRLSILQGNVVCHRWIAADVIVSSAITQSLELTPRLPLGVLAAGAAVVLRQPKMRVMIVPGSWDTSEAKEPSTVTFEVSESLT
jgi:hypothetical protein